MTVFVMAVCSFPDWVTSMVFPHYCCLNLYMAMSRSLCVENTYTGTRAMCALLLLITTATRVVNPYRAENIGSKPISHLLRLAECENSGLLSSCRDEYHMFTRNLSLPTLDSPSNPPSCTMGISDNADGALVSYGSDSVRSAACLVPGVLRCLTRCLRGQRPTGPQGRHGVSRGEHTAPHPNQANIAQLGAVTKLRRPQLSAIFDILVYHRLNLTSPEGNCVRTAPFF
ncbi:hypothetical protein GGS23DRAFT_81003 [Durotheca rogersii]|uniref:uncharacterized protein n=1 Tax=Durotheca rogersii TaxID=419775 RepID=UPI00221F6A52|nr:uncharacterized protein GGS23DRAFT_81003 [Durotheca rogersii]KAI5862542.1 hypothetical protein GGS23DRAFT_81003 [Durotheca rogersii]